MWTQKKKKTSPVHMFILNTPEKPMVDVGSSTEWLRSPTFRYGTILDTPYHILLFGIDLLHKFKPQYPHVFLS